MIPYTKAKTIQFKEVGGGGSSPVLEGMSIGHPADKTTFKVGEVFDITGLILFGEYTDDFLKDVTLLSTSSIPVGSTFTETYSGNVTFSYEGYSVSYAIEVASALPTGYTELTALHHKARGDLDLGVFAGNYGGAYRLLEVDLKVDSMADTSGRNPLFGAYTSTNYYLYASINYGNYTRFSMAGKATSAEINEYHDVNVNQRHVYGFDFLNDYVSIDGVNESTSAFDTVSSVYPSMGVKLAVTNNNASSYIVGDFYGVKLTNQSTEEVINNFVPCKDPNDNIGFYDTVAERFIQASTSYWSAVE